MRRGDRKNEGRKQEERRGALVKKKMRQERHGPLSVSLTVKALCNQ